MLDFILPLLKYFDQSDISYLERAALRLGHATWVAEHLKDFASLGIPQMDQETAIAVLERAAARLRERPFDLYGPFHEDGFGALYFELTENRSPVDVHRLLVQWLGQTLSDEQMILAGILLDVAGNAADIEWWSDLKPHTEVGRELWSNLLFTLRRRRWHDDAPRASS
jgi:hypothetical protein